MWYYSLGISAEKNQESEIKMKCEIQIWHLNYNYEFPKHSVHQYLSEHTTLYLFIYVDIFTVDIF